ncbi:M20 metallopeptidase family protein [Haloimpatiens lingqiaonensis]|uniref:M20 metallopeptidase family protein n=1 Tax=Haloimpatiens lingqiaonensis TaxID=1380675 RepID=UPI0010FD9865|nr:M20 family metallopeptidase [Haloimpatiens lingqiaonensis]
MDFFKKALEIKDEVIEYRRDFHKHPELDYELPRTSSIIKEFLEKENIEYKETAKSGICALIKGNGNKTIAIRADMDALPIQDKKSCPYSSLENGKMHACGHDAHMAILIGTAKILNSIKDRLEGNVKLLFEPAEETTGGAKLMVKEGVLDDPNVDAVIGLHVEEWLNVGEIGLKKGVVNAASNPFTVKIIGKGGHGASPNDTVDPIVISANVINALQTIISREISPTDPGVITIGSIHGGTAQNIIPEEVEIKGIMRTMKKEQREYVNRRFVEIVEGIVTSMRGKCEINIEESYPNLYNDDMLLEKFKKVSTKIFEEGKVKILEEPRMGVESFAYFSMERPSVFYYLGCRNEEMGIISPAHSSHFDIDEDCIPYGIAMHCAFVEEFLNKQNSVTNEK